MLLLLIGARTCAMETESSIFDVTLSLAPAREAIKIIRLDIKWRARTFRVWTKWMPLNLV